MKLRAFTVSALAFITLEIASLALSGRTFGVLTTLLLVIADVALGRVLFRKSGASLAALARPSLNDPKRASDGTADGLAFGAAAVLFMMPGFFSDLIALGLLLPLTRSTFSAWLERNLAQLRPGASPSSSGLVIEGEAKEIDPPFP
jgi:UPF0716 protein FxsA